MIKSNATLVLGAGASKPYGFPLGGELRKSIIGQLGNPLYSSFHTLRGNERVPLMRQHGFSDSDQSEFVNELRDSAQSSVDAFLLDRPEFMGIGKLAIAANLVMHENPDILSAPEPEHEQKNGIPIYST